MTTKSIVLFLVKGVRPWGAWSSCSVSCSENLGQQWRYRDCKPTQDEPSAASLANCEAKNIQARQCSGDVTCRKPSERKEKLTYLISVQVD